MTYLHRVSLALAVLIGIFAPGVPLLEAQEASGGSACSQPGQRAMCADLSARETASKLRKLVRELQGQLDAQQAKELEVLLGEWTRFTDQACSWESSFFRGGPIAPTVYAQCVAALNDQRIQRLKLFLCEGRGLSGECAASRKYD